MEAILPRLRRVLPDDTVIAADMTEMSYLANEVFPVGKPRCWLHPMGFGTLGYACRPPSGRGSAAPSGRSP